MDSTVNILPETFTLETIEGSDEGEIKDNLDQGKFVKKSFEISCVAFQDKDNKFN
jgi:hypothetical protein